MRFLIDVGIGTKVSDALADGGHEASHLVRERLERLSDEEIIEKAHAESRIILTHDLDFTRLLALSRAADPSAIVFRLSDMKSASVIAHLLPVLREFEDALKQGAIVSVTDFGSRCRRLPIFSAPREDA